MRTLRWAFIYSDQITDLLQKWRWLHWSHITLKAHPHTQQQCFQSSVLFPPFPASDDAVLHSFVQTVLRDLYNGLRYAFSSLCQDSQDLQGLTLHECVSQALLRLHHVLNDDRSAMTEVGYFTEQQRLYYLKPVGGLRTTGSNVSKNICDGFDLI